MNIELQNINKSFNGSPALRDISLTIPDGELVALLGPSGSGKTTLLRIIAGLEQSDQGSGPVRFGGENVARHNASNRQVGFVFQHYALFRHMTVFENIAFGLRVKPKNPRPAEPEIRRKVHALLNLIQLDNMANRYPSQLSGGQRQRVALARALAVEPRVLLLDEPFGALDAKVRMELRRWLRRLHDDLHVTSVFVTHDQEEALEVADRVVVMNEGRIEQFGTPDEVFHHPASRFVMNFLGNVNIFRGRTDSGKALFGPLAFDHSGEAQAYSQSAQMLVRPENVVIHRQKPAEPSMDARIVHINTAGPQVKVDLLGETGENIHALMSQERFRESGIAKNDEVFVTFQSARVFLDDYSI